MVKRLLIIIPTLFLLSASSAFADGNIVAILVALRNQGICTDSCTIREYDSSPNPPDAPNPKLLRYYDISSSSIREYDSSPNPPDAPNPKLLRYYDISSSSIREYDSSPNPPDAPNPKLLRYYSISSSSIREYDSDSLDCKLLRYYSY